jgi:hypothetical protein
MLDTIYAIYGLGGLAISRLLWIFGLHIVLRGSKPDHRALIVKAFGEAWRPWSTQRGKTGSELPPDSIQDLNCSPQGQLTAEETTDATIETNLNIEARPPPPHPDNCEKGPPTAQSAA